VVAKENFRRKLTSDDSFKARLWPSRLSAGEDVILSIGTSAVATDIQQPKSALVFLDRLERFPQIPQNGFALSVREIARR
jgi:hypothetical protein